jgi:hypothetical protein
MNVFEDDPLLLLLLLRPLRQIWEDLFLKKGYKSYRIYVYDMDEHHGGEGRGGG